MTFQNNILNKHDLCLISRYKTVYYSGTVQNNLVKKLLRET